MIHSNINNYPFSDIVNKRIQIALDYLRNSNDLLEKPVSIYEIAEGVEIRVQKYFTREKDTLNFETHEKNLDIHFMLKGMEYVYVSGLENLKVVTEYDAKEDITFYETPQKLSKLLLSEGTFIILDTCDAHKAHCIVDEKSIEVNKIVVKIKKD